MPYPGQFHRLVMIGSLYSDTFNCTLSIVPSALGELGMPAVGDATLASVAAAVSAWWNHGTTAMSSGTISAAKLTGIKLNRIGVDGRYVDPVTYEHTYPTPIASGVSSNEAPQLAVAITLRTAIERGRASKGRFYLPPTVAVTALGTDGRSTVAQALAQANGAKALITSLNSIYTAIGRVGVASDAGAGRFEHVTHVSVGRVPDTMRSRRSTQDEDYQTVTI